jgi:outer membrane protein assembly factor BamA
MLVRAQRNFHVGSTRLTVAAKGGNVIGDLPPYEAFPIGGANSVRGYPEGGVGKACTFHVILQTKHQWMTADDSRYGPCNKQSDTRE